MNRPLSLALLCLPLSACSLDSSAPQENARSSAARVTASYSLTNWMGSLDDGTSLSAISIPGSHESGSTIEPFPGTAACQNLSIGNQLAAGVRYFDIRCVNVDNAFLIQHGVIFQDLDFGDVVSAMFSFLSANPSETILMNVKEEEPEEGSSNTFEQTFDSYVAENPNGWYLADSVPNLGDVRGKIVLFRRFSAESLPLGVDVTDWGNNEAFAIAGDAQLQIEDDYIVTSTSSKWNDVTANLNAASRSGGSGTVYLTFTSGYENWGLFGVSIPDITAVSNVINPDLTSYFQSNTSGMFGITAMDFVDSGKASLIIATNFN
jgi:1-phosphatidylinositol phosphodiesterase